MSNPPPPPPQPGQPQPYGQPYQQPQKKKTNWVLIILIVIGVLILLFCGGCLAVGALFSNSVDNAIEQAENEDKQPGGPDNPLEITEGDSFEVYGFDYQDGWSLGTDALGDMDVKDLKFENNRDDADSALVIIKLFDGNEVVASADCTSDQVDVGTIGKVTCLSTDPLPDTYDKITIQDSF